MPVIHAIYGLRVATSLALPGIPAFSDSRPVDVRVHMKEFPRNSTVSPADFYTSTNRDADGQPVLCVCTFAGESYFGLFYSDGVRFAVERQGREVWVDWPETCSIEDACTYLVGPVMGFLLRLRGVTCLHASAIAIEDRAIAFLGSPGAGKSTTAAAFVCTGFPVLSDDVVALAEERDCFLAQPGYPRVNLWPDSVRMLFGSEDALPCITPGWDKRYIALNQSGHRFESKPLPLGAIYVLYPREAGLAAPVVEEISGNEALLMLVGHTYVNYLLDRNMQQRDFGALGRLLAAVPVRRVRPTADPAGIFSLCNLITADVKRLMAPLSALTGNN